MEILFYKILDLGYNKRDMVLVKNYITRLLKRIYITTEEFFNFLLERTEEYNTSIENEFDELLNDACELLIDQNFQL